MFITISKVDHDEEKRAKQNSIACSRKFEVELALDVLYYWSYWQTQSIAGPLCDDSRATCYTPPALDTAVNFNKCKKLQFIHELTASDTSKTAKITKVTLLSSTLTFRRCPGGQYHLFCDFCSFRCATRRLLVYKLQFFLHLLLLLLNSAIFSDIELHF